MPILVKKDLGFVFIANRPWLYAINNSRGRRAIWEVRKNWTIL